MKNLSETAKRTVLKNYPIILGLLAAAILAIFFLIRGLDFGLPENYNHDEQYITRYALDVALGNFHLKWFNWPGSLLIYTNGSLFFLLNKAHNLFTAANFSVKEYFQADLTNFYLVARLQTVTFALGLLALVFLIGRKIKNNLTGLVAVLFLASSYMFVRHGHFITTDLPVTFFIALAVLSGLLIAEKSSFKWYVLGALAVGFGTMTKYPGLIGLIPVLTGHFYFHRLKNFPKIIYFLLLSLFFSTLASPFFWFELPTIKNSILSETDAAHVSRNAFSYFDRLKIYLTDCLPAGVGFGTLVVALFGGIYGACRKNQKIILIITTGLLYLLAIAKANVIWERWVLPLAPIICLLAAFALAKLNSKMKRQKKLARVVFLILFVVLLTPNIIRSLTITTIFASKQKDCRTQSRAWLSKNIAPNSKIVQEAQTPSLPKGKFLTTTYHYASDKSFLEHQKQGVEYFLLSEEMYGRFFGKESIGFEKEKEFYRKIFENYPLVYHCQSNEKNYANVIGHQNDLAVVKWFFSRKMNYQELAPGPTISLYQIKN